MTAITLPGIDPAIPARSFTRKRLPVEQRFWSKVDKSAGPDACWPWTASITQSTGRGQFFPDGRKFVQAHRFAYELAHGAGRIPPGKIILHAKGCLRTCCNPAHLRTGTNRENTADARREGKLCTNKLNPSIVLEIVRMKVRIPRTAIAATFGVSPQSVDSIFAGRAWGHITGIRPAPHRSRAPSHPRTSQSPG